MPDNNQIAVIDSVPVTAPILKVFFRRDGDEDATSHGFRLEDLDLGYQSTAEQVKEAAAAAFHQPVEKFRDHIMRHEEETGNITLMPHVVYG